MAVYIEIRRRSEALSEANRVWLGILDAFGCSLVDIVAVDLFDHAFVDLGEQLTIGVHPVSQGDGERDDELTVGDIR